MKKLTFGGLSLSLLAGAVFAGGYKIPEQSIRSTGTAGAYFSSANTPDAAYYNPANMSFMKDGWGLEVGLRYIVLPSIKFEGAYGGNPANGESKKEEFFVPYFHYVSPKVGNLRFGLSFVTPAGLSKRWDAPAQKATAKKFLLEVYELDLSASYLINKNFAIGGGIRGVYAKGEIQLEGAFYSINMDGDTDILPGYFLSLSFKPTSSLTLSTLYRSKVNLKIKGDVSGILGPSPLNGTKGDVKVPLPAEWRLGASYQLGNTTLEFTYERTFWSAYKKLDFNYDRTPLKGSIFDDPKDKNWKDTNTYRFAIIHKFNEKFTGLAGIAYDETPVPEKTLGFELPDSDGWIFSLGGLYNPSSKVEIGLAYLYFMKKDRSVNNSNINGKFKDLAAHVLTLSLGYKF